LALGFATLGGAALGLTLGFATLGRAMARDGGAKTLGSVGALTIRAFPEVRASCRGSGAV
jgi:hypothetical protein